VSADYYPECPECGEPIDYCPGHESHVFTYRFDVSDWWCEQCDTVSDFCQQINPH
jgi:hypothetical protein